MIEWLLMLSVGLLPIAINVFLQKKIVQSKKCTVVKSIGNFLLGVLLQVLFLIAFIFILIQVVPSTSEGAGWLFVVYVIYSPFILLFTLLVIVASHFIFKKRLHKFINS